MDFSYPIEVRELEARAREFVHDEVVAAERFLEGDPDALERELERLRTEARARGLWAPHMPSSLGGLGLSLVDFAPVAEALGRSPLAHYACNCAAPDAGNMEVLLHFADDAQREAFLVPLVRGDVRSCFAMTEPDRPGSNPTWMATRAVRDGDGFVLDGRKWFVTGADGAAFAIVMAVTAPEAPAHERASLFVVPSATPGFRVVRNISVMGHAGRGAASHSEVELAKCRVPTRALLGKEGAGFAIAQHRLGPGRIHHCMRWIGVAERALDLLCERALAREIAPGEPLARKQIVQEWIAEARAEIDAARLLVLRAAWRIDKESAKAARGEVSAIKFHVAGVMRRTVDRAIQVHGAAGLTDATPLAYWHRFERGANIYDGADEVHKTAVARAELAKRRCDRSQ